MQQDHEVGRDPEEDESPHVRTTGDFETRILARSNDQREKRPASAVDDDTTSLERAWDRSRTATGSEPTVGDRAARDRFKIRSLEDDETNDKRRRLGTSSE